MTGTTCSAQSAAPGPGPGQEDARAARVTLAIIGAGPSCTYVLDRLAAATRDAAVPLGLDIHVFDKSGQFGAGQVHSPDQPATSYLNRIVGQVGFAADESVVDAGPLLDPAERPTLLEWCRRRFRETGDPVFDLTAEDWPKRYVHGQALRGQFDLYVRLLRQQPGVRVWLHPDEVVDLDDGGNDDGLTVITASGGRPVRASHVLMVTGHSSNDPLKYAGPRQWADFALGHPADFVPSAYPLDQAFRPGTAGPERVVGCLGMGLTAIDVILHLTEGRGGRFAPGSDGLLEYRPSGAEPASIVVFSRAGLFTFARPYNAKERNPRELEHRGTFLVEEAVDRLRVSAGLPVRVGRKMRRQLDFRGHLLPVVVLEMAHLYYTTLFGHRFGVAAEGAARPEYEAFLDDGGAGAPSDASVERLLAPLERAVDEAVSCVDGALSGKECDAPRPPWAEDALTRFLTVVFGPEQADKLLALRDDAGEFAAAVAAADSPFRHHRTAEANRFSWDRMVEPVPRDRYTNPQEYREALLDFIDVDHRWAAQNNLWNPAKAAADGVWRDLRDVLAYALDFGGLRASSHRDFLDVYMRHHNRLCNGAALVVMEKIRALVRHGLVDVSVGPEAVVETDEGTGRFRVRGPLTGAERQVDVLVDSRVHPFDAEKDAHPLYPNLLRRGLVRKWTNPGRGEADFSPGGLDLTDAFHPVRADGRTDSRLTLLGPPSEGVMFFQLGALRPHQNHHVMQDILLWLKGFWSDVTDPGAAQDG
ncbi:MULTISPECIES: FAD/NAD(P)-binding protein [Streptomyces]|uniref:FAD/NAD(P)-binding protein n=1 Tax=Streptomyces TaxID=1883 RepID=UPI0009971E94|nr:MULTISPECIES: FAD/NAD(P)-binding protein [Streptomyces]